MGISITNVIDKTRTLHLICSICTELVEDPAMLKTCEHMFCRECIKGWNKFCKTDLTCPDCRQPFVNCDISNPNRILLNLMGDIRLNCANQGCDVVINYRDYTVHSLSCDKAIIQCNACTNYFGRSELEDHKERFR